ncbi:MAG: MoaD/ThiS family protein [Chloroflexi bacterium]|nr:MoaD/ThiS family protein [Chloroflexota bacterium]
MPTVWIPSLMRDLTGGRTTVTVEGLTVRQVIDSLEAAYPGVKARLCDGDRLSPSITVAVDGVVSRLGMRQPTGEHSEITFIPTVSGGDVSASRRVGELRLCGTRSSSWPRTLELSLNVNNGKSARSP